LLIDDPTLPPAIDRTTMRQPLLKSLLPAHYSAAL